MAMVQAGMGLGRVVLFIGAGLAAPTVIKSGKFSDVIAELQVRTHARAIDTAPRVVVIDPSKFCIAFRILILARCAWWSFSSIPQEILREKGADGASSVADAASEVAKATRELQQYMSAHAVTILQVDSTNGAVSALVAPAAAVGAVSYCYLWWKGISLSSLMYVTKRNMANAVASMTKHLEQVQSSLAAAKRHLAQRIQHVDDKLDQQKQISGQIKDEVTDARLKLKSIGSDMHNLKDIVMGLDEKMDSIESKQEGLQRTVKGLGDNNNTKLQGLGIRELLAIESAKPSGGRTLPSTVLSSARLMLP
ncbi:hypothetical protein EJB05_51194 [Eragrostis curvula]|uniref:DUF1664 domain-containing protein n=1 Tax=Eragrostis curvula TaxID=38414 RepID=A0A5J9SWA4_9POAL|nr:hypothetical protein EJB05_51194 [Eragrostis curvula]